jgi:HAD superfamily hydrolase (TIGR01509 family)
MVSLFREPAFLAVFRPPETEAERQDLVKKWHQRKTEIYKKIIASGKIAARSGVKRLSEEALGQGWVLGVCSTSAREAVDSVLLHAVGEENARRFSLVLAGDVVKTKKPAADIYVMAARELQVCPEQCVVVEDSRNGLLSAIAAGMKCVITINEHTREEDFSEAAIVLSCLGDPGGEKCIVLANRSAVRVDGFFCVAALEMLLAS